MKIKVMGKVHREGISKKTNKAYNYNQLHYLGYEPGVEGQAALTVYVDPSLYPYADIKIGGEYNVEYNARGYVIGFAPAS